MSVRPADVDKLKGEIADLKATVQTPSCDYVTGYISALSVVEGMIATLPTLTLDDLRPKGRWEWLGPYRYNNDGMIGTCSVCKERLRLFAHDYCPSCGVDMRGGGEDEY